MNAICKDLIDADAAITNVRADLLLVKLNCRPELVPVINRALEALNAAAFKVEEAAKLDADLERIEGDDLLAEEIAAKRQEHASTQWAEGEATAGYCGGDR